jgi:hypothetical protein
MRTMTAPHSPTLRPLPRPAAGGFFAGFYYYPGARPGVGGVS